MGSRVIGALQQVIHAYMIEVCQCAENLRRKHSLSAFVICVCPLGYTYGGTCLGLCQIVVFP